MDKIKQLINYCNTKRDFNKLFPSENYNFSNNKYSHFLYFDKEEGELFLSDYFKFVLNEYKTDVFSYDNYFSVAKEFEKYLDSNNVFFYKKTKMGVNILTSPENLFDTLLKTLGKTHVAQNGKNIAFSASSINNNKKYHYEFFNYLKERLNGYNFNSFVVEKLMPNNILDIQNYFKGQPYPNTLPFYLSYSTEQFKDIRKSILECVFDNNNIFFDIKTLDLVTIGFVSAHIENNVCDLNIYIDNEFYDSKLNEPLEFIYYYVFENTVANKIKTINNNKGLAFSAINGALTVSKFTPDYSLESANDGYSKIGYELTRENFYELVTPILNNTNLKFS